MLLIFTINRLNQLFKQASNLPTTINDWPICHIVHLQVALLFGRINYAIWVLDYAGN